ncbi:MAG: limonene-1,2-epoxide hydrolase family protein [Microthrixaceae bacterium]
MDIASQSAEAVELVEKFWATLAVRDFDGVGAFMAPDGHYVDVPVKDIDVGAYGPAETAARLRLGLAPLAAYEVHDGPIIAANGFVVTEHSETWTWEEGITVTLPFASVMQVADGKVTRWWDYFDIGTIMNAAPPWWIEHIANGYK